MSSKPDFALYGYFRSSAAFRARIALNLKGIKPELRFIHLLRNGGEQHTSDYKSLNPQELIPALAHDGHLITQSMAIIEYLEETHPEPPLLPGDAFARARIRSLAQDIACEIHPINNLRVLRFLVHEMKLSEDDKNRWYRHWVESGLEVVERRLAADAATGTFCHGDTPTLADCVLVPQIHNAQRLDCRLDHVPTVMRIFATCMQHDAFAKTQASACPDAA